MGSSTGTRKGTSVVTEAPVREDPGAAASVRAGGPPRFFALLTNDSGLRLVGTCVRGMARSVDGGRTWAPTGPTLRDSDVNALTAMDDGTILAAAGTTGLLRSDDRGATWEPIGPTGSCVYAVTPDRDGLLVGARGGLLHRSAGGGWEPVANGAASTVYRLARLGDTVLAATEHEGMWRRDETGWAPTGVAQWPVHALAVVDRDTGTALAGTRGGGVHRTVDDGRTWTSIDWPFDPVVHVIAVAPDGAILAGTGRGVVRSDDGGVTWTEMGGEIGDHRIFSLAVTSEGEALAGSYEGIWSLPAPDGRWKPVDTGLSLGESFAVVVRPDGTAFAGGPGGPFRSADGGRTWTPDNDGIAGATTLCFGLAADGTLLAGTDDGVRRLDAQGRGWERAGLEGVRVFRLDEPAPGRWLAGTLGHGAFLQEQGADWQPASAGMAMVYDFARAGDLYAATGDLAQGAKTGGVLRSTDGGATWVGLDHEPISVYRVVASSDGVLVAGAQRTHILRSHDGGASWTVSRPQGSHDQSKMYCMVIDADDRIYLGSGARLLCSDDRAESWQVIGRGLDGITVYGLAFHPDGSMLAATSSGMYRSEDSGVAWHPCPWPAATSAG